MQCIECLNEIPADSRWRYYCSFDCAKMTVEQIRKRKKEEEEHRRKSS